MTSQSPRRIASANERTVAFDNGRLLVFAANISPALSGLIFCTLLRTQLLPTPTIVLATG